MTNASLKDAVEVRGRFHRSVQLASDWQGRDDLDGYLPTSTARDLTQRIVGELQMDGATRAWSITGPYGTGKSAFALFLADLLGRQTPRHQAGRKLREDADAPIPELLPVLVVGQRSPVKPAILAALAESLRRVAPSLADKASEASHSSETTDDQVVALMTRGNDAARQAGWDGLLLVLDEFGKFLEYAALHPDVEDLFVMQDLAEEVARDRKPTLLITLLHTAFSDYLLPTVDEARKAEWRKVQGRFTDVAFQEPPEQLLRLVSSAIARQLPPELEATYSGLVENAVASPALAEARRRLPLEELLPECVPLDPVATLVMWPLFRSKLAQNERSLFAFLTSTEPFGFREFLDGTKPNGDAPPVYRLDRLYDYVTKALGSGAYRGNAARYWTEVEQALDRIGANAPEQAAAVIKTVGLLNMYGAPVGLKASGETISLALGVNVDEALTYLERASVLVFRRFEGAYGLWEGSDVDIDARFAEALGRLSHEGLAERLGRAAMLHPVVARAHYIKTGTLRYFEMNLIEGTEDALRETVTEESSADGSISFVLCRPQDRAELMEFGKRLTRNLPADKQLRVLAFPDPMTGLAEALEQVEGWDWVQDNSPELKGDPAARRELWANKEHAHLRLEEISGQVLGLRGHRFDPTKSAWIQGGVSHELASAREFSQWLSAMCADVYHQAPELQNELLNRERLSSAAAAARRNLLQRMIEHEAESDLGITGTPAEASMYQAMLIRGEFHNEHDERWRFGKPTHDWRPVWEAIEEFLDDARSERRSVEDLFALLKRPPFGLREGPLPVLFCAVALANRDNLALYEDGVFAPEPGIELYERLLRVPKAFTVRRFALTEQSWKALDAVGRTIGVVRDGAKQGVGTDVLQVVRPLVLFAARLPAYARQTKKLAPEAVALRAALLRAKDPHDLLFSDIPKVLDVRLESPEGVAHLGEALRRCIVGLQQAYPRLLELIEEQIRDAFDLRGDDARSRLEARAKPLVGYAGNQALGLFVREAAKLGERDWREVLARTLVDGTPPEHWRDRDLTTFGVRLQEIASGFLRLEELVAEKQRTGEADAQILRVGILNGQVSEARGLVAVNAERAPAVEDLAGRIAEMLDSASEQGKEGQRIRLAALARVVMAQLDADRREDG